VATVRVRDIRLALCLDTRREIGGAMIIAVRAASRSRTILLRHTNGLPVGCGSLPQRRDLPIILAVAQGLGRQEDVLCRLTEGVAVVPRNAPMSGLQCRRVGGGAVPLACFAPLPPLRGRRRSALRHARRLLLSTVHLRVPLGLRRGLRGGAGGLPLVVCSGLRRQ
jgi:hypothetical protein